MSFTFDNNDSEELDLTVGGDDGGPANPPAQQAARPVTRPAGNGRPGLPSRPVGTQRTHQAPGARPNVPQTPVPAPQPVQKAVAPQAPARQAPQAQRPAQQLPPQSAPVQRQPVVPAPQPDYEPEVEQQYYVEPTAPDFGPDTNYYAPEEPAVDYNPAYGSQQQQQYNPQYDNYGQQPAVPAATNMPRRNISEDAADLFSTPSVDRALPEPIAGYEEEPAVKKGKKEKTPLFKKKPAAKKVKPAKKSGNNFAGDRRKVLIIRIVAVFICGIIFIAGMKALFAPASGPSKAQVQSAAQQSVNYTGFPTAQGEGTALGFTKAFLNYSPKLEDRDAREKQLLNYAPDNIVKLIDPTFGATTTTDQGDEVVSQNVTDGPYIVNTKNIDANNAVVTTMSKINNYKWIYLQIPLVYNAKNNALSVSGYPTFVPATKVAKVDDASQDPQWSEDQSVEDAFRNDLTNYLKAWSASDSALISRYITEDASLEAKAGLGGNVTFTRLDDLSVESIDKKSGINPNIRRAQANVTWEDPTTKVTYSQAYRMTIKYDGERWYVSDIQNNALVSGENTADTTAPAPAQTTN